MTNKTIKIALTVLLTTVISFALFSYYLPSGTHAVSSQFKNRRVDMKKNWASKKTDEVRGPTRRTEVVHESPTATELGVPPSKTVTLAWFDPLNIKKQKKKHHDLFKIPDEIIAEVDFWKDIYTKYDKTKVVLHDRKHMDIIYGVIDISDIENSSRMADEEKREAKKERVQTAEERLRGVLVGMEGKDPSSYDKEETEIAKLFKNIQDDKKFEEAGSVERLRSQTGIADKFARGVKVCGKYIGEMENVFAEHGIPLEITRLAFVESTFNLNAVSKVGASGLWQFMPSTGRLFLTVNKYVDERNDPIAATDGAARHLKKDYDVLGSWPLAINAYNTGRGRLEQAVSRLGTKNIATIIKKFDYPGYKFASRNFYPAFLAALHVFENRDIYFRDVVMDDPLSYDVVTLPFPLTLKTVSEKTGVAHGELVQLNPQLQEAVIEGRLPLPAGFGLRLPPDSGEEALVAISKIEQKPQRERVVKNPAKKKKLSLAKE